MDVAYIDYSIYEFCIFSLVQDQIFMLEYPSDSVKKADSVPFIAYILNSKDLIVNVPSQVVDPTQEYRAFLSYLARQAIGRFTKRGTWYLTISVIPSAFLAEI